MNEIIALPDDARLIGYRETRPFHWEMVYQLGDFSGTEQDFLQAGKAYAYRQIDQFTRYEVRS
jgi:hypothetical protein